MSAISMKPIERNNVAARVYKKILTPIGHRISAVANAIFAEICKSLTLVRKNLHDGALFLAQMISVTSAGLWNTQHTRLLFFKHS
jgi:hypothetical protein